MKPVRLRQRADLDLRDAIEYLLDEAGEDIAVGFIDAVEVALAALSRNPRQGSLRFAFELDMPELRCWPLGRHPYLVFYVERETEIDVWRILHTRRDLSEVLHNSTGE